MTVPGRSKHPAAERPLAGSPETRNQIELEGLGWGKSDDAYRMDSNKLHWHKDRMTKWVGKEWRGGERIAPLHVDMGISTGCNLGCKYCYGVEQERDGFMGKMGKMKLMPLETIIRFFDSAKTMGVRSVAIVGEGENTLNPALYPALEHARAIELDLGLATHGRNIREEDLETLLSCLEWLRINISAATPAAYKQIHQRDWFGQVMINTERLVKGKTDGRHETTLGYQMVITKENMDQIVPLARLGRDMGVDYTVLKACSDTPERRFDSPDREYLDLVDVFHEAETYSTPDHQVIVRWQKLGNLGNKDYQTCHGTRFIIAISGDGTVFPCGHWFYNERERFSMGNINKTPFEEIIMSDKYWQAQNEIHCVDLRYCETNCRQHSINQTLYNVSQQPDPVASVESIETPDHVPLHVNFV